jgi:hypothetical protein
MTLDGKVITQEEFNSLEKYNVETETLVTEFILKDGKKVEAIIDEDKRMQEIAKLQLVLGLDTLADKLYEDITNETYLEMYKNLLICLKIEPILVLSKKQIEKNSKLMSL